MPASIPVIKNILILDSEGKRIAVKYFGEDWPNFSVQTTFEKNLYMKTQRTNARGEGMVDFPNCALDELIS